MYKPSTEDFLDAKGNQIAKLRLTRAEAGVLSADQAARRDQRYRGLHEAMDTFLKTLRRMLGTARTGMTSAELLEVVNAHDAAEDVVVFLCGEVPTASQAG